MYSPFKNSVVIKSIERANDLLQLGRCTPSHFNNNSNTKKRSRDHVEQNDDDAIFKEIIKELDYAELYPTFRTLVLERFYIILGCNPQHEYYDDICKIVVEFQTIIKNSDKILYDSQTNEEKGELYYYLTDELKRLLYHSQQIILLFHLSANSP